MATIFDVCDYIILMLDEARTPLNSLKLHKLMYYCQAWSLAFGRGRLFNEGFQAWVHGPVVRPVYDRFISKSLYSPVTRDDIRQGFDPMCIESSDRALIDAVLEKYAPLTGDQLEEMTHQEDPWKLARMGLAPTARSERVISDESMQKYYGARLSQAVSG
ncbi:Panacea domain-containing protein [Methylosinus sp. Ce-a6]|uniref:Panacea domain-containing protein n=1 Tax=Methylosinus sp. Ce-a6 TaxID=2172005 RepID=UPI001357AA16|nr:type II toxin-antitoxin system antitoxin SocA domain-containing protein [Methylosinus sp. Ce-a6]